jgi:hypothetical protein
MLFFTWFDAMPFEAARPFGSRNRVGVSSSHTQVSPIVDVLAGFAPWNA